MKKTAQRKPNIAWELLSSAAIFDVSGSFNQNKPAKKQKASERAIGQPKKIQ